MSETTIVFLQPEEEHQHAMHALRKRVYTRFGYLAQNGTVEDHDEYDPSSVHFVAVIGGQVVGTIRLIRSSREGFPVEKYFGLTEAPFTRVDRFNVVEVSRLAVEKHPGLPAHAVTLGLIKTAFTYCIRQGWIYWYLAADSRVFKLLRSFRFSIAPLGEAQDYLGSPTIPAFINIRNGIAALQMENPNLADFLMSEVAPSQFAWYEFRAAS